MKFYRENLFQFSTTTLNSPPIGAYRVFPMPIESPLHGGRDLIYQPWTKAQNASPFTWHGDGIYLYYSTRGNNADVYEDSDGDDLPTGCLLYTSDAADERSSVDLGGRRIIKKKTYR